MENVYHRTHRLTPTILRELKSLALGLVDLCAQPTTRLGDIIRNLKDVRICEWCGQLHDQDDIFCSTDCALAKLQDIQDTEITGDL